MKIAGIHFPTALISALRNNELVVFAGAGVSMGEPGNLPSFSHLAEMIAEGTGESRQRLEPEDRFLGRLAHKGINVHTRVHRSLALKGSGATELHRNLVRLYGNAETIRIVTTNFDLLFEQAAGEILAETPEVFRAPALPLGRNVTGIVHVHGSLIRPGEMVLTDADFGRAYLTEGWARQFLVELFRHYAVLFVGYAHNDTVVSYLARALPVTDVGKRFALTSEHDDVHHWEMLGVEPIIYPKPNKHDYSHLAEGVRRLADMVTRSVLDWKREVTELASGPPPLSEEDADIIEDALQDATTVRFFIEAARLPEWIGWLDHRSHLSALFSDGNLTEKDQLLAFWLAKHFAVCSAEELFLLIAKNGMRLHPRLWGELGGWLAKNQEEALEVKILSRWIAVLLATAPPAANQWTLHVLGKRCVKEGATSSLLDIFDAMAETRLNLKPGFSWPEADEQDENPEIHVTLPLVGEHHYLNTLWQKGLQPKLTDVAEPLLRRIIPRLEDQHARLASWQQANREWDSMSFRRSAIEAHEQDRYPDPIDVIIDAARDCLEWLAANEPAIAARWCEHIEQSEAPLLRRLTIHTLSFRADLPIDGRIKWLLTHVGLHDISAHHEIFRAVRLAYPRSGKKSRETLIRALQAFQYQDDAQECNEIRTASYHLSWLDWLQKADPECAIAKQALDTVAKRFPQLRPSEHADFTHWSDSGFVGSVSPWSTDELLAKPPAEWLPELLSFQPPNALGPDRRGLALAVTEACKRNFDWSLELAGALEASGEWQTDLWQGVIRAWTESDLEQDRYRETLVWINRPELHANHDRAVADALYALVRNEGTPFALEFLSEANKIASSLWIHLEPAKQPEEQRDWLTTAINHPAGVLADFWLSSLSIWRKHQDPKPKKIGDVYHRALSEIVRDQTLNGILARSVLTSAARHGERSEGA